MNLKSLNNRIFKVLITFLALLMPLATAKADNTPLCFTAKNGNVTVQFDIKYVTHTIQYSTNGTDWSNYTSNTPVTISANQTIRFRAAENQTIATSFASSADNNYSRFYFTSSDNGTVEASGNMMSLYGPDCPDLQLQSNAFAHLFYCCTLLTTPPELPATHLANLCYSNMFNGCTALTTAPALPANIVSESCYGAMFSGCTSLTTPPALNATLLYQGCYENMFQGCTALTDAPALPGTTLAEHCYSHMFDGCSALKAAPELPATTMAEYCYESMFNGCTFLRTTPTLPAVNLAENCYQYMFSGCTSLVSICDLPATILFDYCYAGMFYDCCSLTVNVMSPGKEWIIPAEQNVGEALLDMFGHTGGTIANENSDGTPYVNKTYYIAAGSNKVTSRDGNWDLDENWSPAGVPVSTDVVTILHAINVPAAVNAHCESIEFGTGGTLVVSPSASLHASTITNDDACRLAIESDEANAGTVRFTNSGSDGLKATVQIYLKGSATDVDNPEWQYRGFIGTPDEGQTLENAVMYKWDETKNNTDYWVSVDSYTMWDGFAMTNLDATNVIRSYSATLPSTNEPHTFILTKTTSGNGHPDAANCGVNLLTNSYSASVNMDEVEMDDDLEHTFYFFNTRTHNAYMSDKIGSIITYPKEVGNFLQSVGTYPRTTSPYIPAGQSFAVKTTVNGATLTIPATAISTVSSGAMYAPSRKKHPGMVIITVEGDEAIDDLFLLQMDECTSDFDNGYDGSKMFSSTSHQIYAQNSYGQCAVNADKSLLGQYVGFKPQSNTIQDVRLLISSRNLDDYAELYLYDYLTDRYVEITGDEVSYPFTSTGNETPRRFQIVGKASDGSEYNPKEKERIEVAGNEIWLMNFDRDDAQVILSDAAGRTLWSVNAKNGTTFTLPDLPKGIYFVSCGKVTTKYVQR